MLDLSSLASKSVRFRWRLVTDNNTSYSSASNNTGWWIDDVRIFTCEWSGGSITTSNQNLVTLAESHYYYNGRHEEFDYNDTSSGSDTIFLPMLFRNTWGVYHSAAYILNLDENDPAQVQLDFFDTNGSHTCTMTDTIPPLSSHGFGSSGLTCLPNGWKGSLKIKSTNGKLLSAIARIILGDLPGTDVTTYIGIENGSTKSFVPMLFKNTWGLYQSAVYIQNIDTNNTATIKMDFYDTNGNRICTMTDSIPKESSVGYGSSTISCLPDGWKGSLTVTSTNNVAIASVARVIYAGEDISTYSGFAAGSTNTQIPIFYKAYNSYQAALYIQNVDTNPANVANVSIDFYNTAGQLSCHIVDTIQAKSSVGYGSTQLDCLPNNWQGSIEVTSNNNIPVVAVARVLPSSDMTIFQGYNQFNKKSYIPMLFKNLWNSIHSSAIHVKNVSSEPLVFDILLYDTYGNPVCTFDDALDPKQVKRYWLPDMKCSQ